MDINQLTHIFCQLDDFCKDFIQYFQKNLLPVNKGVRRGPCCSISESEIMTILIMFQSSGYRNFKIFYTGFLSQFFTKEFPKLPSYNRFIELMPRAFQQLVIFTHLNSGKHNGIYYIDSTCLPVCHLKRSKRHRTFDEVAAYGKTSVGWFFGLKLHLVINSKGELIAFKITSGNTSDITAGATLLEKLQGLAFGDKGYIGKKVFDKLLQKGLKLITRTRKNMSPKKYSAVEKQLLDQRGIIETVINHFKHHYQVWHTRHRSIINAMTHLLAAVAAYIIEPLKISAIKFLNGNKNLVNKTPN